MSSVQCPNPSDCDFEETDELFDFCSWSNINRELAPVATKTKFQLDAKAAPQNGSLISLKCKGNDKYWCAESGGASYIVADRGSLADWEVFRIVYNDDNTVSIISLTNDKYVYIGSIGAYMYLTTALSDMSKFNLILNDDGSYALKSVITGKYLTCKNFPTVDYFLLIANKDVIGDFESFYIDPLAKPPEFFDWAIYTYYAMNTFGSVPDHTINSEYGHFILANGKKVGDNSTIFSQIMEATSDSGVCFSFYYRFNGSKEFLRPLRILC